ncbi:tetratricopeptide repeat-containing protein [Nocardiopsis sp. NRRL B-16309]|uniref:tetratricopeptide repeat-containing protein n=1 Tax=Nocardiopsis sp. NRRL B-16309 TaxID=1519494 RepID=UPI000ADBE3BB|nr:tetratricopeptide repeat-containing protein [Nocardiopsis sp. NRRL B-16309]
MNRASEDRSHVANTVNGDISGSTVIQGRDVHLIHHPAHEVDWPIRVGAIPEEAAHYQRRAVADQLDEALHSFGTVVLRQVLSGTGGVGKTQLAVHHARALRAITDPERRVDVLVWANAATRTSITSAYAHAAQQLYSRVPEDPEDAARHFLTWLSDPNKHQNRRWLVIWDDLANPAAVQDLWPPYDQAYGRVLVTTRRRDHSLSTQGRHLIDMDVYTPAEAHTFLTCALHEIRIPRSHIEMDCLSRDLGYLPLALGQAVTYMAELGMSCADYLELFHDRMNTLDEVFPDWDTPASLAATWELSLQQADTHTPQRVARPLMGLLALLDGSAIVENVLTAPPTLKYLSDCHPTRSQDRLNAQHVRTALTCLHRFNLISRTIPRSIETSQYGPGTMEPVVRVHQLIQRATREHHQTRPTRHSVRTLADSLIAVWPELDRDTALAQQLRDNTLSLKSHYTVNGRSSQEWLWDMDAHPVLFRTGRSLGEVGRVREAVAYWEELAHTAQHHLGSDHPDTLSIRADLARWRSVAGDTAAAGQDLHELIADRTRILGSDHPDTLSIRADLARWRGVAGDTAAAAQAYEELLPDQLRVLGPDHPDTLSIRADLARWRSVAGDTAAAAQALEELLPDQLRVLGPDHPHTLTTRHVLAYCQGETGYFTAAAQAYEELLADRIRVLGPDHPHTLSTRGNFAYCQGEAGHVAAAVRAYEELLPDAVRVLGSDHPDIQIIRARWAYFSGDILKGIEILSSLICDRERVIGPNHPETRSRKQTLQFWQGKIIDK